MWLKSEGKGSTSSALQNLSQMHYSGSILDNVYSQHKKIVASMYYNI